MRHGWVSLQLFCSKWLCVEGHGTVGSREVDAPLCVRVTDEAVLDLVTPTSSFRP